MIKEEPANYLDIEPLRLRSLVNGTLLFVSATLMVSVSIAILLWETVSTALLISWMVLLAVVSVGRLLTAHFIKRALESDVPKTAAEFKHYGRIHLISVFFPGVVWGLLGGSYDFGWPNNAAFLLPFCFAAIPVLAVSSFMGSFKSYCAFVIPCLTPLIFQLYLINSPWTYVTLSIYLLLILILARKFNHIYIAHLYADAENSHLVGALSTQTEEQKKLLKQVETARNFSRNAFDNAGVAMALVDKNGLFFQVNKSFCTLTGKTTAQLEKHAAIDFIQMETGTENTNNFTEMVDAGLDKFQLRMRYKRESSETIWIQVTASAVRQDSIFHYAVLHVQNVSQEQKLTQHLSYQAQHDFLTGLPNRYSFDLKLKKVIESLQHMPRQHVLCYLDLDRFKIINDTCGHLAGDALLRQFVQLLQNKLRDTDLFSRIGGDEFAMLLFDCNLEQARNFLTRLLMDISNFQFYWETESFTIGASIGIVALEDERMTPIEAMKKADSACYAAKESGRNRIHAFSDDDILVAQLNDEVQWVARLQHSIEQGEMIIYKQDIMPISKDKRRHCELLIRLLDTDGTVISPAAFIPAAERYNLATKLDLWMTEKVLSTLQYAHQTGKDIRGVFGVNLSGASLGDVDFHRAMEKLLSRYILPEESTICFEITETAAISNLSAALNFIEVLRKLGCEIALDDFGSGLSSFAYLKQLPIDYLKIDGMFVKDCLTDPMNLSIVEAMVGIGRVMGIDTIAEYVETDAIYDKLVDVGVDYMQGFWNGQPEPWDLAE